MKNKYLSFERIELYIWIVILILFTYAIFINKAISKQVNIIAIALLIILILSKVIYIIIEWRKEN